MSKERAEQFLDALKSDASLRSSFESAKLGELGASTVTFAKSRGFEFSLEDLHLAANQGELSEAALDGVSGGVGIGPVYGGGGTKPTTIRR